MGDNRTPMARMRWISDLKGMKHEGTVIRASCQRKRCGHWWDMNVNVLIRKYGEDADIRDYPQVCERCGGEVVVLASPGTGTPFRPVR